MNNWNHYEKVGHTDEKSNTPIFNHFTHTLVLTHAGIHSAHCSLKWTVKWLASTATLQSFSQPKTPLENINP